MAIDFSGASTITKNVSTTILGLSTTGITKPLQPAFNAIGQIGTTSGNYVIFPSTQFNIGSGYSVANGRFTAPVAGVYYFKFNHITGATAGEYRFGYYKNTVLYSGSITIIQINTVAYSSVTATQHIQLAVSDYVNIRYVSGPGAMYAGAGDFSYGQFSGYLVG